MRALFVPTGGPPGGAGTGSLAHASCAVSRSWSATKATFATKGRTSVALIAFVALRARCEPHLRRPSARLLVAFSAGSRAGACIVVDFVGTIASERVEQVVLRIEILGQPPIDHHGLAVRADEEVRRLEITVDDALGVCVGESVGHGEDVRQKRKPLFESLGFLDEVRQIAKRTPEERFIFP